MNFRYLIRALGTQFELGRGFGLDFPFGVIEMHVYKPFERMHVEFMATGFELMRWNSCGKTKAYCFLEMKVLGNALRIDTETRISFLNLVSYIKNSMSEYDQVESLSDSISEGSQI
jgi:hypothetical protein